MPWSAADARKHTGLANTKRRQELWSETANKILANTGDEGQAIRIANSAVRKHVNDSMYRRSPRQQQPRFL